MKFFKIGKRVITLALSAALILGEASVSLAAPKASFDPDTAIEVMEESEPLGAYAPGKVSNVRFKYGDSPEQINPNWLYWDAVQGATYYEIKYVDPNGTEYVEDLEDFDSSLQLYTTIIYPNTKSTYYNFAEAGFLYRISSKTGGYEYVKNDEGDYLSLRTGLTYKIYVRAVRVIDSDITYGPWSDGVNYSVPKQDVLKAYNIKVFEDNDLEFNVEYLPRIYAEVEIKDSNGNYYYSTYSDTEKTYYVCNNGYFYPQDGLDAFIWEKSGSSYVRKENEYGYFIRPFIVGKTYTIRFRTFDYDDNNKKVIADWSEPINVTVPKIGPPPAPGNLTYHESNPYRVEWNSIRNTSGYKVELQDSSGNYYGRHEVPFTTYDSRIYIDDYYQIKKNADGTFDTVYDSNGNRIYADKRGMTYKIRVQAYNHSNVYDNEEDVYPLQYSAWSDVLTFTVPKNDYSDVTKVKGLRYGKYSNRHTLFWNTPDDTTGMSNIKYEVEIKDSKGRFYKTLAHDDSDNEILNNPTVNTYFINETNNDNYKNPYNQRFEDDLTIGLTTYVKLDDRYEPVIFPHGGYEYAFRPGETYTTRVRMHATVTKADDSGTEDKTGAWSDTFTFTVPGLQSEYGYNTKPAAVTGLYIKDTPYENETLNTPVLAWNLQYETMYYEVEVQDAQNHVYSRGAFIADNKLVPVYYVTSNTYALFTGLSGLPSYSKVGNNTITMLYDSHKLPVHTFVPGQTYKFRVRGYNMYYKQNADGSWTDTKYYVGDWSQPISYTVPNYDLKVSNLKYVRSDDNNYYFDYTANAAYSNLYYQVATKSDFSEGSIYSKWLPVQITTIGEITYKFYLTKNGLEPDTTYYVRVVNSKYGKPSYDMEKSLYNEVLSTAAVTSFKTEPEEKYTPKNITGLKLYTESSDSFTFRFDPVLEEDVDYYEVQTSRTNDQNSSNWSTVASYEKGTSFFLYKNQLLDGTTYVRVRGFVYQYDKSVDKRKKVYGNPSNVVAVNMERATTSSIGVVSLLEETDRDYVFTFTGNPRLSEIVYCYVADTSTFDNNGKEEHKHFIYECNEPKTKKFMLSKDVINPGKTYYIRMRVFNSSAKTYASQYSSFSNVVKFTATMPKVSVKETVVGKTSVTISMDDSKNNWVCGYEYQRRTVKGKKTTWKTIAKTSSMSYTDKKLKAFKSYAYRIRPYYFNKLSKTFTYGEWSYTEAMTGWPGNINVVAKAASKTSVKLSWNKVKGAKGYEIYRCVANSKSTKISNGYSNDYSSYQLIKTLKSGKKSYTDKKLISGMKYSYMVKAYKKVGKKKVYISGSADVSLDFYMNVYSYIELSNGKLKIEWSPVLSGKGYKIEKYDYKNLKWVAFKTINKAKTSSYTLPACTNLEGYDRYRIYAFNGKKISNYVDNIYINPFLATPTNVKAKVSGKKITISWNAVPGADFYRVFRTSDPYVLYDSTSKTYDYRNYIEVGRYIPDSSAECGYRYAELEEMKVTSVTDEAIIYTKNGISNQTQYSGPKSGVKYNYFVVAYKNIPQSGYKAESGKVSCYPSGYSKAASATIKENKPGKPVISKGVSKKKTVTLTIKGSVQADGYEIERSKKQKKGYTVIGEATGVTATYKDKYNKKKNKIKGTYYYRVRSFVYNDDGTKVYSAYSKAKKVKVK